MRIQVGLLVAVILGVASAACAAEGACEAVRITPGAAALPEPWAKALAELVEATKRPGQPWSCVGGTVTLDLGAGEGAASLTVVDRRGRPVTRPVESAADVVPVGKALLAAPSLSLSLTPAPLPEPPPPAVPSPPPAPPAAPTPHADSTPQAAPRPSAPPPLPAPRDPRILFDVQVGPRISGPQVAGWTSVRIAGAVPFERWALGLFARYDYPFHVEGPLPVEFSMDAAEAGLLGARQIVKAGAFELRATVEPALSLVMMEAGDEDLAEHPEGAAVAFRLGAGLDATFPIGSIFRGIARLDGELAPAGFGEAIRVADALPAAPVYTVGLSIGAEVVVP